MRKKTQTEESVPLKLQLTLQRLFGGVAVGAVGEPGDGANHPEPAERAGGAGDLGVVEHQVPLSEEDGPVALVAANERKRGPAGVRHVHVDVQKIFEKPEGTE